MNAWALVWLVPLRGGLIVLFSLFYVIGGRRWKWIRRFLGGLTLAAGLIGLSFILGSFNWWFLALLALYPAVLTLGYGGNSTGRKVVRRLI